MDPAAEARLTKIRSLSKIANRLCIAAISITCLLTLLGAIAGVFAPNQLTCSVGAARGPCSEMSTGAAALVLIGAAGGVALLLKGLYHLSRLFKNYGAGQIFTRDSVTQIRKLGETVFAYAIFEIVLVIAAGVLLGMQESTMSWPADRPIGIPFASFIAGALIILIARVMEIGTELREESELTV
jgi:hypothetical protein